MTTFNQAQGVSSNALNKLTGYNWRGIQYQVRDLALQPLYPPLTLANVSGDVVKIFPDGSVYMITEAQWREFGTRIVLPLE